LINILGNTIQVEHIGSTAVRDLAAKPVIDIMIGAPLCVVDSKIELIQSLGYVYFPEYEKEIPLRRFFAKFENGVRKFHLHALMAYGESWENHIFFRDYLRLHPEIRVKYQTLKVSLAEKFLNEREKYTDAKSDFIKKILEIGQRGVLFD